MAKYTQEELIDLGKRVVADREKANRFNRARNAAIKALIASHPEEYQTLLDHAQREFGLT